MSILSGRKYAPVVKVVLVEVVVVEVCRVASLPRGPVAPVAPVAPCAPMHYINKLSITLFTKRRFVRHALQLTHKPSHLVPNSRRSLQGRMPLSQVSSQLTVSFLKF